MPDSETQGLLNKDLQQLASAKHFLGNFNHFKQKAKNQYELDELVQQKRNYMLSLIRIGLENMP